MYYNLTVLRVWERIGFLEFGDDGEYEADKEEDHCDIDEEFDSGFGFPDCFIAIIALAGNWHEVDWYFASDGIILKIASILC